MYFFFFSHFRSIYDPKIWTQCRNSDSNESWNSLWTSSLWADRISKVCLGLVCLSCFSLHSKAILFSSLPYIWMFTFYQSLWRRLFLLVPPPLSFLLHFFRHFWVLSIFLLCFFFSADQIWLGYSVEISLLFSSLLFLCLCLIYESTFILPTIVEFLSFRSSLFLFFFLDSRSLFVVGEIQSTAQLECMLIILFGLPLPQSSYRVIHLFCIGIS